MTNSSDLPPSPKRISLLQTWLVLFIQSIVFGVVLVVVALTTGIGGMRPELGQYALWAAVLAAFPSIPLWRTYRERLAASRRMEEAERVRTLHPRLVLGLAVADLPALAGFAHYLFTAEITPMVGCCVVTSVIMYLYRPVEN
ncbi:MAG: hypothetical protein AMJ72_07720 [Acidithiobacillales bacterium SM1_46]|jgi:hypothetical protein|nr:MAG: hypothetical protein AMJ72_07720 [Acidithiobacillales bacterium SM1_46]